jgi:hypothetical protein
MGLDTKTYWLTDWLTVSRNVTLTLTCYERRSVGQSALGVTTPFRAQNQILVTARQMRVCWCRAPSLTRRRFCRLQLLLVLAREFSSPITSGLMTLFYRNIFQIPPKRGRPDPSIYIPQEQGGHVITPGTGFPLRRLLRIAGLRWKYSKPPESELHYDWRFTANRFGFVPNILNIRSRDFFQLNPYDHST